MLTRQLPAGKVISIHALREEGDAKISQSATCCSMISIHALREEGDILFKLFWSVVA